MAPSNVFDEIPVFQIVGISDCRYFRLSVFQTVSISDCQYFRLSVFQTVSISDCRFVFETSAQAKFEENLKKI
jgi:hypothetical protein